MFFGIRAMGMVVCAGAEGNVVGLLMLGSRGIITIADTASRDVAYAMSSDGN